MENFIILFRPTKESFEKGNYVKIVRERCQNCDECKNKSICPFRDTTPLEKFCKITSFKTFAEAKGAISYILTNDKDIEILILIDSRKDIAYIYKGNGDLEKFKKGAFTKMIRLYEIFSRTTVFLEEIRDLRGIPINYPHSSLN